MASLSLYEVRRFLLNLLPPGADRLYSLLPTGDVYRLFDGFAEAFKVFGFDLLDRLRTEVTPAGAADKLPDWEQALGLTATQAALHGTIDQRRARVLARLREFGAFTREIVGAVVAPLLGYTAPGSMTFVVANRLAMTAAHTYTGTGVAQISPAVFTTDVFDGGRVTRAGAQVTVTISHPAVEQVLLQLTAPSGQSRIWSGFSSGPALPGTFRLAAPELACAACGGRWTLAMTTTGQPATMIGWRLFVEGIGPGGLAGDIFDWGIYLDPAHLGENGFTPDLPAASLALARIQHAHTNGHLIRALSASPDTPGAIPDQFLPG